MRMNRKAALAAGASFGMAFLAACSDTPVAPAGPVASVPNFAVGDAATSTPVPGKLIVCKAGNIGGDFTVTRTSGSGSFDSDGLHLNPGQCVVVAEDGSPQGSGSVFRVHEVAAANVTYVVSGQAVEIGFPPTALVGPTDNQDFFINSIHGIRVTYTNTFTAPGCTLTQGFWKTHGPNAKGNNTNQWDLTTITLGTVNYTQAQAQAIFETPVAGNGLISLAHQLIAAKLNIANGANGSTIAATIAAADALIGSMVVPPVGGGFLAPSATSALTEALDDFNTGVTGPGHCD